MTDDPRDDGPESDEAHETRDGEQREHGRGPRHRRRHRHHRYGPRKERVLHTRVSEQLSDDIRRFAEDLRVPASNLVRNVLEEVFTVVESMSDDVGGLMEELLDEAEGTRERIRSHRARRHRRRDPEADASEVRAPREAQRPPEPNEPAPQPEYPEVIGWQPLVLNHASTCATCGHALPRGARAFVGLGEQGLTRTTLCRSCTGSR